MLQPLVRCQNPDCEFPGPIPLPPAILPETVLYPNEMPTDISGINVVCRNCGHWRKHTKIEWGVFPWPPKAGRTAFPTVWRVALQCADKSCGTLEQWYLFDNSVLSSEDVLSFVVHAKPPLVCKKGHAFYPGAIVQSVDKVAEF